jgi:hypothetical protein
MGPGIRKPKLKLEDSLLLEAEKQAANILDTWMRARGETNVSLSETWGISESIIRDLRRRDRPLTVGRVMLLPKGRARSALFDLFAEAEIERPAA